MNIVDLRDKAIAAVTLLKEHGVDPKDVEIDFDIDCQALDLHHGPVEISEFNFDLMNPNKIKIKIP